MVPALLTTFLWALSTIFAQRSLRAVGMLRANLGRLVVAFVVLGLIAHLYGNGMGGAGRNWLLLSGVIGMGLGDLAFFRALPKLGSRLTILLSQCLAAPIAALVEWLWLGTQPSTLELALGALILVGVGIALSPSRASAPSAPVSPAAQADASTGSDTTATQSPGSATLPRFSTLGLLLGLGAAAGQAVGAVVSRKANLCALAAGEHIDGFTAAYQRITGGLLITGAYYVVRAVLEHRRGNHSGDAPASMTWKSYLWIPLNASCGAILGVSCYQWALFTAPSAIVMAIVALTPLVVIPLSFIFERERPSLRSLLGGLIAVAATAGLALSR